jgi:DNA (cytosine-5)-methyltransferase 1
MAGKREEHWGMVKKYSDVRQRTDDLFYEFARLLEEIQPKVFVAENVSGLVKGAAKGYFIEIIKRLKSCGYNVKCKVLNAQWLGVPQSRQRTIFIGTRNDLNKTPFHPLPLPYFYSLRDVLPYIKPMTAPSGPFESDVDLEPYALGREWDKLRVGERSEKYFQLRKPDPEKPMDTVQACHGSSPGTATSCVHPFEKRKFRIDEIKVLCSFPADFILTGNYAQQWERMGRAVPPFMMRAIAEAVYHRILK